MSTQYIFDKKEQNLKIVKPPYNSHHYLRLEMCPKELDAPPEKLKRKLLIPDADRDRQTL